MWTRMAMVVVVGLVLASCAPRMQAVWRHQNPERWARDSYECEREAQVPGPVVGMPIGGMVAGMRMGSSTDEQVMARCLQARGWSLSWRELPR